MRKRHAQASETLAGTSDFQAAQTAAHAPAAPVGATSADPLADVLRTVKLTGALFFMVDASSPWHIDVPEDRTFADIILPRAQHVISYHIVTAGSCWGGVQGQEPVRLTAGDIFLVPHGDPYAMMLAPQGKPDLDLDAVLGFFRSMAAGELPFTIAEGGGGQERLHLVCGFLGCDVRPFNPLLATLPRALHVRRPENAASDFLSRLIELTVAEAAEQRPGGECIRLRLSELMFVEVMRRHLAALPNEQTGWLAGLRDPIVGRALALLHRQPAHEWTLEQLAGEVAVSRSTLAERFTLYVGQPPMQYLTQWRMQLAARLLTDGTMKVAAVAREVGYASEAAFSRAFTKLAGTSPAKWRR